MSNQQSGYQPPVVVPLKGGLDLITSRFLTQPGTLQDCLNYETYGTNGYTRIDGFQRYDGSFSCYSRDWLIAVDAGGGSGTFTVGEYLLNGTDLFGICVYWDSTNRILHYLLSDSVFAPNAGDTITGDVSGATVTTTISGIKQASEYYSDMDSFISQQNLIYSNARSNKKGIYPYVSQEKNIIPHGMHWFNGKLYAIIDHYKIQFSTGGPNPILPGDHIRVGTGGTRRDAIVLDVNRVSGAWTDSNAAGYMLIKVTSSADNTFSVTGAITLIRPNGATATTTINNAAVLVDYQLVDSNWGAGIYYALADNDVIPASSIDATTRAADLTSKRWKPLDMGWELSFRTDSTTTGSGISTLFRSTTLSATLADLATNSLVATSQSYGSGCSDASPFGSTTTTKPVAAPLSSTLGDGSDLTWVEARGIASGYDRIGWSVIKGFNISLPSDAIPTGIRLTVRAAPNGTGFAGRITAQLAGDTLGTLVTSLPIHSAYTSTSSTTPADILVGGVSDLWGMEGLTASQIISIFTDPNFGFTLSIINSSTTITDLIQLYGVTLTVFYRANVSQYYAFDPISKQDLSIKIPYYALFSGSFNPGSGTPGEGVLVAYDVTPLDSTGGGALATTHWSIEAGWQLRTARSPDGVTGGGSLIAIFSSGMKAQMLPCRSLMKNNRLQYEIITANFYANKDWISFYGVSGLSPAFTYDGFYFYKFYTAFPKTEDTPQHICYHRNHLCLGYENGQVVVSLPGDPLNYNPILGSTSYPVGDPITNLLSLNGTALGIFAQQSIHALTGTVLIATADNDANLQIISPYSGAIAYSAVDCGSTLYADHRGISTIEATQKYGDFDNGKLSYKVSPFLQDRVTDRFAYQSTNQSLLFAKAIRNKNQCRYYFSDGFVLTCSLPLDVRSDAYEINRSNYEFTKQKYVNSSSSDCLVPVAMCTGTSKQGRDLFFSSMEILPDDPNRSTIKNSPEREMYVYSMDEGNQFDNAPIKHFVQINFLSIDNPIDYNLVRNINVQILNYNYFNGYLKLAADYLNYSPVQIPMIINPIEKSIDTQRQPAYMLVKTAGRGISIGVEIGGEHINPGHVLQALIIEYASGRTAQGTSPIQTLT